eukprot:TRINITY_DN2048_c0_g1_i17.p2 TRINITY_DN2048_c0_g1~~TRINITY_DN2048_c0_g1_i17.p2  ORF type:complete len:321 (-),score=45.22 TRINITY_DN2048_c0_g1_i17:23-985(-)
MKESSMFKRMFKPIVLILLSIILYINTYTGLAIVVFVIYLVDNFYQLNYFWNKENDLTEFIKNINQGISKNVLNLIYPLVIINEDGSIVWNNDIFNALKSKDDSNEENILSIARGLNLEDLIMCKEKLHQRLEIENKLYDVYATLVNVKQGNLYLLSFNDITKLIDYETTQESIVLIEVDNLPEVLDNTDENNRPLLIGEIERTINLYASSLKAMIKKYDTNKYVFSVQDKYIEDEIIQKFRIVEDISKIEKGNKIKITLSIGIGKGGMSPQENYNNADIAKELALGRGGDQVVVKDKNCLLYTSPSPRDLSTSRMPSSA